MLGAVSVPLQTSAAVAALLLRSSPRPSPSHRVERRLSRRRRRAGAHRPHGRPLVVFDYRREVDDHREALRRGERRGSRPGAQSGSRRCRASTAAPDALPCNRVHRRRDDPLSAADLHLRQHRRTEGRDVPASTGRQFVAPVDQGRCWAPGCAPSITLNFMPMSHVMGRGLSTGRSAPAAPPTSPPRATFRRSWRILRLVRPTQLSFVPRIWDMIFAGVPERSCRRPEGVDRGRQVLADLRQSCSVGATSWR